MSTANFTHQPIIGLEIHVQLKTRSKMFCGCKLEFGAEPNSRVCPVCLGLPGALPVINAEALNLAMQVALALNCRIAGFTKWDRKSYYYPDLPKNYQISQYDLPLAEHGVFEFEVDGEKKKIRIKRAHLEEDAGKNLHDSPEITRVDLNRTGTPLLEIVTEPDFHSSEECYVFATELQRLVTYLGASEGSMQKGHMRFEPNINMVVTEDGAEYRTPICEVKNLNSFRSLRGAVDFEIKRHLDTWQKDHKYTLEAASKENRGWDDDRNETVYQRSKEEAHDYRYFPDPDLVPVTISEARLEEMRQQLPELPMARRARLMKESALSAKDALQIVEDQATADLFDQAVKTGAKAKLLGKHFKSFWAKYANARGCPVSGLGISAQYIGELARMQEDGKINATAAAAIAEKMLACSESPSVIAKAEGLEQVQDTAAIEAMVDEAIANNSKAVGIAQEKGKKWEKSLGFLQGQVMQKSKGSASPQVVRELLVKKLGL